MAKPILRQSDRDAIFREESPVSAPVKLYRGINVDTTSPGLENVHAILHPPDQTDPLAHHPGWDHPEIGGQLLDWMGGQHEPRSLHGHPYGPAQGLGGHWSTDPLQAESFARWAREDTGHGGDLQAVIEAEWGGEGEDPSRAGTGEFDEKGNRIRSFPWEHEKTLFSGTPLTVTNVRIRPYDDAYWNSPADLNDPPPDENHEGPWHQVLSQPSPRTAAIDRPHGVHSDDWYPNFDPWMDNIAFDDVSRYLFGPEEHGHRTRNFHEVDPKTMKPNHPTEIVHIAQEIAKIKGEVRGLF